MPPGDCDYQTSAGTVYGDRRLRGWLTPLDNEALSALAIHEALCLGGAWTAGRLGRSVTSRYATASSKPVAGERHQGDNKALVLSNRIATEYGHGEFVSRIRNQKAALGPKTAERRPKLRWPRDSTDKPAPDHLNGILGA